MSTPPPSSSQKMTPYFPPDILGFILDFSIPFTSTSSPSLLSSTLKKKLLNQLYFNKKKYPKSGGFPCSSVSKESACNAGDPGLIPESG